MNILPRKFWLIVGLWTFYGVLMAVLVRYRLELANRPIAWSTAILSEVTYAYLWAILTPAILLLGSRCPVSRPRWYKNALLHLAAAFVFAVASKALWDVLVLPYALPDRIPKNFREALALIAHSLDYGILNYALVLIVQHAMEYSRRYEEGRLRASQLEAQLATSQLQALKMQLHPHFLFNSLNAISELVHEDPYAAERMIARLSEFLRLTLDDAGAPEVTLSQELDFLKRYLEIEKMRFEDRLKVDFQIDPDALGARVPNLILQPLVENALRHGVGNSAGEGLVRIRCAREDGRLTMKVYDNGPGVNAIQAGGIQEGVGLGNTRKRLERMYEGAHGLALANVPSGGFEVSIDIPFRQFAAGGAA